MSQRTFFWFKTKNCQRTAFDTCNQPSLQLCVICCQFEKRVIIKIHYDEKQAVPWGIQYKATSSTSSDFSGFFQAWRLLVLDVPEDVPYSLSWQILCHVFVSSGKARAHHAVLISLTVDHANVLKDTLQKKKTFLTMLFVSNIHSCGFPPDFRNLTTSSELRNGSRYILEGAV